MAVPIQTVQLARRAPRYCFHLSRIWSTRSSRWTWRSTFLLAPQMQVHTSTHRSSRLLNMEWDFPFYRIFIQRYIALVRWQTFIPGLATFQSIRPQLGPMTFSSRIMSNRRQRWAITRRCISQRLVGHRYEAFNQSELDRLTNSCTELVWSGKYE